MKLKYVCSCHAELYCHDDQSAFIDWSHFMKKGHRAFDACRWDEVKTMLGAAVDIAAIRLCVSGKTQFRVAHVLEPVWVLVQVYRSELAVEEGLSMLEYVQQILDRIVGNLVSSNLMSGLQNALFEEMSPSNEGFVLKTKQASQHPLH